MFSVIIPLYNKEKYIEKAIASVLQQSFSEFELIVVDDGSTDVGLYKASLFIDERLRIFTQTNAGVSAARNKGVSLAYYDYFAFLDADDWWDAQFLGKMRKLILNFPKAALYGSSYYVVKNGQKRIPNIGVESGFRSGYIDYFEVYSATFWVPINCSFVVVSKQAFKRANGFRPTLKFGEDFDLWVRLTLEHKVAYLNECLAYSNQDVEASGRALGMQKTWKCEEHIIFNLSTFAEAEKQSSSLNILLDGLRVRSLIGFYLNSQHTEEVSRILDQVDFDKQPFRYKFIYQWPKPIVSNYFQAKKVGSVVKQIFFRKCDRFVKYFQLKYNF